MESILTDKQLNVLNNIKSYMAENDEAPSLSQLMLMLHIKTKRGVVKHLEALERKGYILRSSKARGIRLVESGFDTSEVPIYGYANAGAPLVIAQEEKLGTIRLDNKITKGKKDLFALIIDGDSMNKRQVKDVYLSDHNYIVIEKTSHYENGDVVLAVIDNAATIKTIKKTNNSIILYPESTNPRHMPIYLDQASHAFINGKVVAALENPI